MQEWPQTKFILQREIEADEVRGFRPTLTGTLTKAVTEMHKVTELGSPETSARRAASGSLPTGTSGSAQKPVPGPPGRVSHSVGVPHERDKRKGKSKKENEEGKSS